MPIGFSSVTLTRSINMKEQIKALKLNLKQIAKEIKNQKRVRKKSHPHHDKYKGDYYVLTLKSEFRHKHVAYCLARGRDLERVDSGARLDMDRVNWILRSMNPESKEKLYVIVNENLSPAQQAVQGAHAVAAFLRKYPNTMWSNGYLIFLKELPRGDGNMAGYGYVRLNSEYADFAEPDLGNKITAYACFGPHVEQALKSYRLV
jgi:hypothetical protein